MKRVATSMFVIVLSVIIIIVITKTLYHSTEELPSLNFVNGSKPTQNSTDDNLTFNLSNNTGHSEDPKVAVDGNNAYVVWVDDTYGTRDIYFRKSTDNGCTFGQTKDISNLNGGSVDPQITASGNNVYVVWEHTPENNGAIYFTKSSDNGNTFKKASNIANNTGFNGFPQIAVSGQNVYLVWHDASHGISFTRSTDNGNSFEKIRIIGNDTGFNGFPQIAANGTNLFIVWTNNPEQKNGQVIFARSTDGGTTFHSPILLTNMEDTARHKFVFSPRIAIEPRTNGIHVVWHSGRMVHQETYNFNALISDIIYTRSTDGGSTFDRMVNLDNKSGWSINPQIAVSNDNNVYVVWTNNRQEKYGQVLFTRSTDGGSTFDSTVNLSIKSGWSINPQIAVSNDKNVYVVWSNSSADYGQVLFTRSTDGGSTFDSTVNLSNKSGWSINPQIAVSNDKNVYVVWSNNATGNEETILSDRLINDCTISSRNSSIELKNNSSGDRRALNIAFVDPTFTFAAYDKSFYMFYPMYDKISNKYSNITEDIGLLSSIVPQKYEDRIESADVRNHLKWLLPNSNIERLTDQDVHKGLIFTNGTNKYDIIVLSHEEYVTQQEYDNFKKFVANGGILVLLDGNAFYAEVKYDESTNSISLVKGHYWEFNGKSAWRSVEERWKNETSKWVGSNFLCCWSLKFKFNNNPFEMEHDEEQRITNSKAKILLDYNVTDDEPNPKKFKVATYELDYKKGKVIVLGLYTDHFTKNERFWKFFDSLLFQYALSGKTAKDQ